MAKVTTYGKLFWRNKIYRLLEDSVTDSHPVFQELGLTTLNVIKQVDAMNTFLQVIQVYTPMRIHVNMKEVLIEDEIKQVEMEVEDED